jgi:hypothetical protein
MFENKKMMSMCRHLLLWFYCNEEGQCDVAFFSVFEKKKTKTTATHRRLLLWWYSSEEGDSNLLPSPSSLMVLQQRRQR